MSTIAACERTDPHEHHLWTQEIEALHPLDDCPSCNYGHGLRDAARIARGDA